MMAAYAEGLGVLQERQHRQAHRTRSTPKPRPFATPSTTSTTSTSPPSPKSGVAAAVIASWLLDLTSSALAEDSAALQIQRPRLRLRRRPLDHQGRHRRRRSRPPSSPPRSTSASARAATPTTPTNFSPPCATNSAVTSKSPLKNKTEKSQRDCKLRRVIPPAEQGIGRS